MIPTPGFQPSQHSDEHPCHWSFDPRRDRQSSRSSGHLDDLAPNDDHETYLDDVERDGAFVRRWQSKRR
jgi:hypothetical protein